MADHAVVIGIEKYPGMSDLNGPCNDALAFRDWLVDPNGGGLSKQNVKILLTSDFPPPASIDEAHPVLSDLENLFRPLIRKAANKEHIAERLFIYLAGHGFADSQDIDSAALYTADAENSFPLHIAILDYANFFSRAWAFDEIIVIMDACRVTNLVHDINKATLPRISPHENASKVKRFVGYGTGFGKVSREKIIGGKVRGIFTTALLNALNNAEPNRLGRVNGSVIKKYIHNTIDSLAGGTKIDPPDIDVKDDKDVLFVTRKTPPGIEIEFQIPPESFNHELVIMFGGIEERHREMVVGSPFSVRLSPGLYKASITDTNLSKTFEVPKDVQITL